jgi:hypothetical protein
MGNEIMRLKSWLSAVVEIPFGLSERPCPYHWLLARHDESLPIH